MLRTPTRPHYRLLVTLALGAALPWLVACQQSSSGGDSCLMPKSGIRGIRNGTAGSKCSFPYVVRITIRTNSVVALCSGTIITRNVVLTAAHCFQNASIGTPVSASVTSSGATPTTSRVTAYRVNPSFLITDFDSADLAILYLETDMPDTPPVLATSKPSVGTTVTALGYGQDGQGSDGNGSTGTFLQGSLTVISPTDPSAGCNTSKNICAHAGTAASQETCEGDSGGPLMNGQTLLGVLSGGDYLTSDPTCRGSVNSIYAPVSDENGNGTWISQQITAGASGATQLTLQ